MIEINLLPQELRKKTPKLDMTLPVLPRMTFFQIIALTVGILIVIHVLLTGILVYKKIRVSNLSKRWQELKPTKEQIDLLKGDLKSMEDKVRTIDQLTTKVKIVWSKKLNIISDVLPSGAWLRRVYLTGQNLEIEGSAVSKRGEEMMLVGRLVSNLKKSQDFYSDISEMDVSTIQRRMIGSIEVVDFVIKAKLKTNT